MASDAIDVGAVHEFALDAFKIVEIRGRSIGVVHTTAGWFAIRNQCPHQGAPLCLGPITGTMKPSSPDRLEWGLDGRFVRCPWHGWEFDLATGRPAFGAGTGVARTYEVRVARGRVRVLYPSSPKRPD